ncbi:hypothetical protein AGMMS49949_02150 [Alphaproteobacteria bacterium]|nr:hypothetical protein AGMMS49949_02150 [Alphaproteobacteria bacterium]GHS96121.1 hypothetical protein AGMMS50296_1950 [Alphaproteobacteria bacterium]
MSRLFGKNPLFPSEGIELKNRLREKFNPKIIFKKLEKGVSHEQFVNEKHVKPHEGEGDLDV